MVRIRTFFSGASAGQSTRCVRPSRFGAGLLRMTLAPHPGVTYARRREPHRLDPTGTHPETRGLFRPRPTRTHHCAHEHRLQLTTKPANDWPSWAARGAPPPRALPTSRHPLNRRTHQLLTQPELSQTADLHRTPHPRDRSLHHLGQHHHYPAPPHPTRLDHPPIRTNDPNDSPDPSAQSLTA